ncbi:hypothetical protein GE061_015967 [Apolygus lucorum]|uniref:Rab3GAP regulatory subunit C-terminal domain-containing protein n=1 Tax=Apolygus lucorum TaxID=248454 RepID=A0A8S9XGV3_APOLU|nr:hypothetical protein GE061_015967 [Apolygus lucorum]
MPLEDATHWIGQCFSLASDWEVPAESIRIQQVVNLYKNNGDRFAEEVVSTVNNKTKLGTELLVIVGQRMKTLMVNSSHLLGNSMAHLSPALSNWIQEQEESKDLSELKDVIQLSALVVSLLPESIPDHKFASLLLEAIQPLAA